MKVTIAGLTVELTPEQKEDLIKQLEKPDKVEPVFKDYLGNEVFEGDVCYLVDNYMDVWEGICDHESGKNQTITYFKHRSDAVAYIERNKLKWSENDVREALKTTFRHLDIENIISRIKKYKP